MKLPLTHPSCLNTVVSAPIEIVWLLLTDPARWGDFFDVRIPRLEPAGSAVTGQRFYGQSVETLFDVWQGHVPMAQASVQSQMNTTELITWIPLAKKATLPDRLPET